MLKIFTIKFENRLESFNDNIVLDFLADKEIIRWESIFFQSKNNHYWSIIVEYIPSTPLAASSTERKDLKKNEKYKEILTENDWPIFKRLREWRAEKCKKEGVPPYILFTNLQLAKIAATRPTSLNALQQIKSIGNSKREKYGNEILQIIKPEESGISTMVLEKQHGN
jgi:superfamily II DNA helicase RecQ